MRDRAIFRRRYQNERYANTFDRPFQPRMERENVIAVLKAFNTLFNSKRIKQKSEINDANADEAWKQSFHRNYRTYARVVKDIDQNWSDVSEDLLDTLVAGLEHYKVLPVRDDHHLINAIPGSLHHSLLGFIGRDDSPVILPDGSGLRERSLSATHLAGSYICYQPSVLNENQVVVGQLEIVAHDLPRHVTTLFRQPLDGQTSVELTGTIAMLDMNRCFWIDTSNERDGLRTSTLNVSKRAENKFAFHGWSQVVSNDIHKPDYIRKMLIEPFDGDKGASFGHIDLDDRSIPENFRKHLEFSSDDSSGTRNVVDLPIIPAFEIS